MRTSCAVVLALLLAACGSKSPPPAPVEEPAEEEEELHGCAGLDTATTPDECECLGGIVKGDIGDGQVACDEGQQEIGRLEYGIEGGVCCKPAESD